MRLTRASALTVEEEADTPSERLRRAGTATQALPGAPHRPRLCGASAGPRPRACSRPPGSPPPLRGAGRLRSRRPGRARSYLVVDQASGTAAAIVGHGAGHLAAEPADVRTDQAVMSAAPSSHRGDGGTQRRRRGTRPAWAAPTTPAAGSASSGHAVGGRMPRDAAQCGHHAVGHGRLSRPAPNPSPPGRSAGSVVVDHDDVGQCTWWRLLRGRERRSGRIGHR